MNQFQLALRNISGNSYRSWVVALCAMLVAGFVLSTTLIMRGAENSLRLAIERLGADIIVVPEGEQASIEGALLMGIPTQLWMPEEKLAEIAKLPGIERVSPQLYLITLHGASCCSVSDMFLVAYDPATDFTIQPWVKQKFGNGLRLGEAVGGSYVFVPTGEQNIKLYGYFVTLKANLEPTGTNLDQSMFLTYDTALDMARISKTRAETPLTIPQDSISTVMVKVAAGQDPHETAVRILQRVKGVTPIESSNLFQAYRRQMDGLLKTILVVLGISWIMSVALIGLVFSMLANERRRELGVLRALGASWKYVFQSLLAEAGGLALTGGSAGIILAVLVVILFRHIIITSVGFPFALPDPGSLILQVVLGLLLATVSVVLAAAYPAYRISRQDPADAMRE